MSAYYIGEIRIGTIVEVDRTHLAVARKLAPEDRRFAAKVMAVNTDRDHPGWRYVQAFSDKRACMVMIAVPPKGTPFVGPKTKVIRF